MYIMMRALVITLSIFLIPFATLGKNKKEVNSDLAHLLDNLGTSSSKVIEREPKVFYAIQVASYKNVVEAQNKEKELQAKDYETHIRSAKVKGDTWFRVFVGHFERQQQANAMLKIWQDNGLNPDAFVVQNVEFVERHSERGVASRDEKVKEQKN